MNDDVDKWVDELRDRLGDPYEVISSKRFLVVSGRPSREGDILVTAMERATSRIEKQLSGIARVRRDPKNVAILFHDHKTFLHYVSEFFPEDGEYGHPGGMFIADGWGHFVLPADPIRSIESSITHELTHAFCSHLELPSWIDEGLAESMEFAAGFKQAEVFDKERIDEHRGYWNDETLEAFWSGMSFKSIDGQRLSYQLAEFLLNALPGEPEQLAQFVNNASWKDAGHQAARSILGVELEELIVPLVPTLAGRFGASEEDPPQ